MTKEHLNYKDIIEIMEKVIEKLILSQDRLRKKDFTKRELLILGFFGHNRLEEKEELKVRLRSFFLLT